MKKREDKWIILSYLLLKDLIKYRLISRDFLILLNTSYLRLDVHLKNVPNFNQFKSLIRGT